MLGAIAGDIIGSVYEFDNIKNKTFPLFTPQSRFTDDTVLSVAVADGILNGRDYAECLREYYRRYPAAGYGGRFSRWAVSDRPEPYNSWGNGSAMRVSPVGFAFDSMPAVLAAAERTALVTHNHPQGIRGAQAIAAAVYLARTGAGKPAIKEYICRKFNYDLSFTLAAIRPEYKFDISCQGSVPPAIVAFLEATGFEDAVRNAISIGGDSDTIACMTGGIAEAFYGGVPAEIAAAALAVLDGPLREVVEAFRIKYPGRPGMAGRVR